MTQFSFKKLISSAFLATVKAEPLHGNEVCFLTSSAIISGALLDTDTSPQPSKDLASIVVDTAFQGAERFAADVQNSSGTDISAVNDYINLKNVTIRHLSALDKPVKLQFLTLFCDQIVGITVGDIVFPDHS
jgi:hypothetical protein